MLTADSSQPKARGGANVWWRSGAGTPMFFVSVAFKGVSGGASCLDATVAGGCAGVDSKRFRGTGEVTSGE